MIAYERRACTVLYNLLTCHQHTGPILLPANVCPIVPITLHKAHRSFEFVDISTATLCIDHEKLLERWTAAAVPPAGLVYVRTYGAIFDAGGLFNEIKRLTPDSLIVDDRCACAPSFAKDALLENVDAVLYSTGYAKHADIGFGGYAFVNDEFFYKCHGMHFDSSHLVTQTKQYKDALSSQQKFVYVDNGWLDASEPDVEWTIYRDLVEKQVSKVLVAKKAINHVYADKLPPDIQLASPFQSWRFNIHVADKPALLTEINKAGLFASGHYDSLNGLFGIGSGNNARALHRHIVNLFNDDYFDVERATLLADLILSTKNLAPGALRL